jgi:hypothetical protein
MMIVRWDVVEALFAFVPHLALYSGLVALVLSVVLKDDDQ